MLFAIFCQVTDFSIDHGRETVSHFLGNKKQIITVHGIRIAKPKRLINLWGKKRQMGAECQCSSSKLFPKHQSSQKENPPRHQLRRIIYGHSVTLIQLHLYSAHALQQHHIFYIFSQLVYNIQYFNKITFLWKLWMAHILADTGSAVKPGDTNTACHMGSVFFPGRRLPGSQISVWYRISHDDKTKTSCRVCTDV